jgi:hypothetical protein
MGGDLATAFAKNDGMISNSVPWRAKVFGFARSWDW